MTTASDREKARAFLSPLWEYLRPTDGAMAIQIAAEDAFVRMLAAVRAETVEQCIRWHDSEIASLDDIEAHPPGLTEYGKHHRRWHVRARDAMRSLMTGDTNV
jgi:hypothetical protein